MPALYWSENYIRSPYSNGDYWDVIGLEAAPSIFMGQPLYNYSQYLIPDYFYSDYFDSVFYFSNLNALLPNVIVLTCSMNPDFVLNCQIARNSSLICSLNPDFSSTGQIVKNTTITSNINPDFAIGSYMNALKNMTSGMNPDFSMNSSINRFSIIASNMNPEFTLSSSYIINGGSGVSGHRHGRIVLAIDRSYYLSRQRNYRLTFTINT